MRFRARGKKRRKPSGNLIDGAIMLLDCSKRDAVKWLRDKPSGDEVRAYKLTHPGTNTKRAIRAIKDKRRSLARAVHLKTRRRTQPLMAVA